MNTSPFDPKTQKALVDQGLARADQNWAHPYRTTIERKGRKKRKKPNTTPVDTITPTKVYGEQWRVEFQADGSFQKFSTRRDEEVSFL